MGERNVAWSGKLTRKSGETAPSTTVANPSRICSIFSGCSHELTYMLTKIHSHPVLPPIPSISDIAAARRPPKEPLTAAAEN
jgi:proteasome lid subunit RPN8/RPN11